MLKIGHKIAYIQAARCHNRLRNNREVVRCHDDHLLLAGRKGNKNKSQRLKNIVARWLENRATPGGGGFESNDETFEPDQHREARGHHLG